MYVGIFSRVHHEWAWNYTTPEGFSIPTPNQTGWDIGVACFCRGPCVDMAFHTHTDLPLRDKPKLGVPLLRLIACVCVHALILITGVYGYLLRGLSPAP